MFERFAEEARRATALASQEARELGHDFIGTEHLLLGLLATGEGTAFSVLTELEVTLDDARRKVTERVHAYGNETVESPLFTPLAKKSLERALREALELDAKLIDTEHLLLGLIAVPDGGGARILGELAGSLEPVRQAVLDRIGPRQPPGPPVEQTKAPVTGRTLRRWAAQGRTVFRPPEGSTVESEGAADEAAEAPAPRCPNCQSSLASEARFRQLAVPAGADDPPGGDDLGGDDLGGGDDLPGGGDLLGGDPSRGDSTSAEPSRGDPSRAEGLSDAVAVTVVYCGNCGVSLGIV